MKGLRLLGDHVDIANNLGRSSLAEDSVAADCQRGNGELEGGELHCVRFKRLEGDVQELSWLIMEALYELVDCV